MLWGVLFRSVCCKLPMCENKIYATRERRIIALRAKRQYVVVPYAF